MLLKNLLTHFFGAVTMATIMHRFFFTPKPMLLKNLLTHFFGAVTMATIMHRFLKKKTYAFKKPSYSLFWGCYYGYYYA